MLKIDALQGFIRETRNGWRNEMTYAATISVWVRWFVLAAAAFEVAYRPPAAHALTFSALLLALGTVNAWLHVKLIARRPITRNHLFGISAADVAAITAGVIVHGGFASFIFLAYYPAVGTLSLIGTYALATVGVTAVAGMYATVCLTVGSGLDFDARDEKDLVWRIVVMYAAVASVAMITRFERIRRRDAVERERALQRERVEISQTIHDTTAQTAYMIGLGLETAMEQARDSSEKLRATLAATLSLSKSAMWDLRRPIDMGQIFDGSELGRALRSHAATFTTITSVPAEMMQLGTEPALSTEIRTGLFSIAHNALTNAYRHANASKVDIVLDFTSRHIRLSISDDGCGLPEGYKDRGQGFRSMRADAEHMGGELIVESGTPGTGTSVTCLVPSRQAG